MVFQEPNPAVYREWELLGWYPRPLPFPLPFFLQALGCLGISDESVIEALLQVVSLGLHRVQERREQGIGV